MKRLVLVTLAVTSLGACFKAKVHLTPPQPTVTSTSVDNNLHFSVLGIFEISPAVNLGDACPGTGAARIEERVSVLGGIVNMVLDTYIPILGVINPTVVCGTAHAPVGPAPAPGPAPGAY